MDVRGPGTNVTQDQDMAGMAQLSHCLIFTMALYFLDNHAWMYKARGPMSLRTKIWLVWHNSHIALYLQWHYISLTTTHGCTRPGDQCHSGPRYGWYGTTLTLPYIYNGIIFLTLPCMDVRGPGTNVTQDQDMAGMK